MNLPLSPDTATFAVVWGALILGLVLGAAGQASRFCVRGAIADWYLYGGRERMLAWVLVVAVAAAATQLLIALALFEPARALPWSRQFAWASYLVGGALFGYGMVLAAGCPQRSLVKFGAGNLKAVVTLLVAAVAAQMTLRGVFAELRAGTVDALAVPLAGPQDLGSVLAAWLPLSAATARGALLFLLLAAAALWLWRQRRELGPRQWLTGTVIGLLVPAAWLLTGWVGYLPEHPETLEPAWQGTLSSRPEALTFTAPIAHALDLLTLWSDKNSTASFGVMLALGVLVGSFVSACWRGEFRVESFDSADELRGHLVGGVLMGIGGVTAAGCSVGQGVTGLAMLSAGAVLAVAGIVAGSLLALRRQVALVERGEV
jgi:uncharacterized membrane protein YedE/YeeE